VTRKRQGHISLDEAAGATRPRIATSKGIAAAGANCAIVAALAKGAAGRENVLEWTTVNADFQHAAVSGVFQRIVIAEHQGSVFELVDYDRRRVEIFIANRSWIIHPCRIRR
jgi:hypothetical protein